TVDSAKTSLPAPPRQGNGACENRALLIPRLKSFRESGRDIAHAFAIYNNCKSIVSSIHGCRVEFFSTARRAPAFSGRRGCGVSEISADERAARLAPRCTNLVSDHRGGSLVVGGRWNRRHVRRWLARFRLALERELEHLVYP